MDHLLEAIEYLSFPLFSTPFSFMSFTYRERYAPVSLTALMRKVWVMDNGDNPQSFSTKTVLPNGCFNLALVQGPGLTIDNRRGDLFMPAGSYFCGQARRSVTTAIQPYTSVTMVQLHPWAVAQLTTASLADTADVIVPLTTVLPALAQVLSVPAWPDEAAVLTCLQEHVPRLLVAPVDPVVQAACQRWQQTHGTLSVLALALEVGCSTRQLEKRFRYTVGLTPKTFATVLRVRGVVDALQNPSNAEPLSQLALMYGFYDQAHFIRVFRQLVQRSPGQFDPAAYMLPLSGSGY